MDSDKVYSPISSCSRKSLTGQMELVLMLGIGAKLQEVDGVKDFAFTNTQGRPYATNAVNLVLKNVAATYNQQEEKKAEKEHREPELLPHISAHILRHTACTRLAESGLEPKVLQYIMGHSNFDVTMDVYNHVEAIRVKKEIEKVNGIIQYG